MTLGEKLQKLRKARSLTQEELAAQLGVSRQSLSKWESDGALPDTANIITIADLFGVSIDYLLRAAEAADAPASPESPAAPTVVQLVQPKKIPPPTALLIGYILLVLGLLIFLGLVLLSNIFPVSVARGDDFVSGVNGFLLAFGLHGLYYASLLTALLGFVTIATYMILQRWTNRRSREGKLTGCS